MHQILTHDVRRPEDRKERKKEKRHKTHIFLSGSEYNTVVLPLLLLLSQLLLIYRT